jgi:valyl-tRNA synthetase
MRWNKWIQGINDSGGGTGDQGDTAAVHARTDERARLTKELGKVTDEIARVHKKLANPDFLSKAKPEVIQKEREKALHHEEKLRTLKGSLEQIREIQAGRN